MKYIQKYHSFRKTEDIYSAGRFYYKLLDYSDSCSSFVVCSAWKGIGTENERKKNSFGVIVLKIRCPEKRKSSNYRLMTVRTPGLSGSIYDLEIISLPKSDIYVMKHSKKYLLEKANWNLYPTYYKNILSLDITHTQICKKLWKANNYFLYITI